MVSGGGQISIVGAYDLLFREEAALYKSDFAHGKVVLSS